MRRSAAGLLGLLLLAGCGASGRAPEDAPDTPQAPYAHAGRWITDGEDRFAGGARTVVALPARQYPDGYTAQVSGARVVSADNAARLVLESETGEDEVRLTVTPRPAP